MNAALIPEPMLEALGWTLLHFLWQGTLVAIFLAVANSLLRKRTANARYALACTAMLFLLVLPVATFSALYTSVRPVKIETAPPMELTDERTVGRMEFADVEAVMASASAEAPNGASAAAILPAGKPSLGDWVRLRFKSLLPWLVFAWALGVLTLTVRFAGGLVIASRLRRLKTSVPICSLRHAVLDIARRLRVTRPFKLCESALVEAPAVIGWLRPVILIPASALTGLSSEQIEALLAHELAHIRRHDYLVNMFQTVVETLLFYHPAVWWVSRQMRLEREHCCDDLAVAACGNVLMYARALAELEGLRIVAPQVAVAAGGDSLLGRIERLIGKPRQAPHQFAPSLGAFISIVAVFGLVALAQLPSQKPARGQAPAPAKSAGGVYAAPSLAPAARVEARDGLKQEPASAPEVEEKATTPAYENDRVGSSSFSLPNTAAHIADGGGSVYASTPANGQSPALAGVADDKDGTVYASTAGSGRGVGMGYGQGSGRGSFVEGDGPVVAAAAASARGGFAMAAVMPDDGGDYIGEMQALGLKDLTVDQWIALKEHGVTPEFVKGMKELGYDKLSVDELIHLRMQGVTPRFVRGLNDSGYSKLSAAQLIELRKHGVTADYVHRMKDAGFDHLSADQLISMRNHGVTPEFIGEMKKSGYGSLLIDQLISLRNHGVNGSYVADLAAAGYSKLTTEQLTSLRMYGVTGAYIQKLRSHGFNNLTVDQLIKLRMHGID
ncbi:MAG TPA: M56 family metallopeptidase [Blastocatellia bacterium]|nr:M56 family metallopeptidase [Blastocatellia bacterium]